MDNEYKLLRNRYLPNKLKAIFILESPPTNGKYFYNPQGKVSEILFRMMMKVVLNISPLTKDEGLRQFKEKGYLLIDPIYEPVDKLSDKKADELILANYSNFIKDLKEVLQDQKDIPLILIKKNIFTLLAQPLLNQGFNVINRDQMIPFPLHYHTKEFTYKITNALNSLSGDIE